MGILTSELPQDIKDQLNEALAFSRAEGREVKLTYCPCGQAALTNLKPGELAYCSNCSALLTPGSPRTRWKWDSWAGSKEGEPSMWDKNLLSFWIGWTGFRISIHKFVKPDVKDCFHTHPAKAIRIVLKGGYREEYIAKNPEHPEFKPIHHVRAFGQFDFGVVQTYLNHRIDYLLRVPTYTLWIRFRKTAEIQIEGKC